MKSKSIKTLRLSKNSVSSLSSILGGMDAGSEPSGQWNAEPSSAGRSWNCDSVKVCD